MKNIIALTLSLICSGALCAQSKRQVDLAVNILTPMDDSSYIVGDPIPFTVVMTNNGPDNLHPNDSFIYIFNGSQTYLAILNDSLVVGQDHILYNTELSTGGQTGEFEIC